MENGVLYKLVITCIFLYNCYIYKLVVFFKKKKNVKSIDITTLLAANYSTLGDYHIKKRKQLFYIAICNYYVYMQYEYENTYVLSI